MAQVFGRASNTIARVVLFGTPLALLAGAYAWSMVIRSPYSTNVGVAREQPVPFSHKHHVAGLGIDCRFCHTSVEKSAFAGMPSTDTCMHCHNEIWRDSPMLETVRASYRTGMPIHWQRVHDLPDFVYFNHSIHVSKGIGCESCHGRVDQMPLVWKESTLYMDSCLDCHRQPEQAIRSPATICSFSVAPLSPAEQAQMAKDLGVPARNITDCYTCHR